MIKAENLKPDSVEELFCKPLEELLRHDAVEMSVEDTKLLFKLLYMTPKDVTIPEKEKPFLYQVIEKRIKYCLTFKCNDPRFILFLAVMSESPGRAVMYLTYVQYVCKQRNMREVTIESIANIFPNGFLEEKELHKLWVATKVSDDRITRNLVDIQSSMKSIQFDDVK